jgi:subtilisin family serine protease
MTAHHAFRPAAVALGATAAVAALLTGVGPAAADAVLPPIPPNVQSLITGDQTAYQWALAATNTPAAWSASTGSGVTVAVIDTGVDAHHPDLQGQVLDGARWVWDAKKQRVVMQDATVDQTSDDWYGHGSHVSGIIAADRDGDGITGVAPDAKILPVQLYTRAAARHFTDITFLRAVAASVRWANAHGAQVANLSLGVPVSGITDDPGTHSYLAAAQQVCDAIAEVTDAGTLVVVSAGNSGDYGNPLNIPAGCPKALTVAATTPSLERTFWSDFDGNVRIAAPGDSVLSDASTVAFGGNPLYVAESGTSMAAPMVTGAAALVFAEHPAWSPDQVANRITATARDWGPPGRDAMYGFGQLDVAAAVGVAAPPVHPVDYVTATVEPYWGSSGPNWRRALVSWNVPAGHAVTSYTIRRYAVDGSVTDTTVAGDAVRATIDVHNGDWIQVIAHTTAGDAPSWPTWWLNPAKVQHDSTPPPVRAARATRDKSGVSVSWRAPADTHLINQITVLVALDNSMARHTITVDPAKPLPTQVRVPLPRSARWQDARVTVLTVNGDQLFGYDSFYGFARARGKLQALYGLHVERLVGAGPHGLEVTGGISALNARRVCGSSTCAGRRVAVQVHRTGGVVQTVVTRLTSEGIFHAVIWRPKGAQSVVLRLAGPHGLTSGPAQPYRLGVGGGGKPVM